MSKTLLFTDKPCDYSLMIQGIGLSGQIIDKPYSKATNEQIGIFEKKHDCTLSRFQIPSATVGVNPKAT